MADREKTENTFLKKLMRGAGKSLMTAGILVGMAGTLALGLAVGVPALMAVIGGAPIVPLLAKLAVTLPYIAGVAGLTGTGVIGGYALARAGGEEFKEPTVFSISSPSTDITRPGASLNRSARGPFNDNSNASAVNNSILALASVALISHMNP